MGNWGRAENPCVVPKTEGLELPDGAADTCASPNPFAGARGPGPKGAASPAAAGEFEENADAGWSAGVSDEAAEEPSSAPVASPGASRGSGAVPAPEALEQGAGEGARGAGQDPRASPEQGTGDTALRRLPTFGAWEPANPSQGAAAGAAASAPAQLQACGPARGPPGNAAAAAAAAAAPERAISCAGGRSRACAGRKRSRGRARPHSCATERSRCGREGACCERQQVRRCWCCRTYCVRRGAPRRVSARGSERCRHCWGYS